MIKLIKILFSVLLIAVIAGSCKQAFEPPAVKVDHNFLVVEGIINTGTANPTIIHLSRTKTISDSTSYTPERGASISIESETGNLYQLQEMGDGSYASPILNLNSTLKYRLRITTSGQHQYQSDYTVPKPAPAIDSLTWMQDGDVHISVNTHDPSGNTRYYQWEYVETWEYDSQLESAWGVKNGLAYPIDSSEQVHTCWIDSNSTSINVATSAKLSEDVISQQPVAIVHYGSNKLSKRYSILVKQYALSREAYEYWQLIKKNTEQLGTLFDAQPSELMGNIHNVSDGQEPVIGYISAGTAQQKRLFIDPQQVGWTVTDPVPDCSIKTIPQNPNNSLIYDYPDPTYTVYYFLTAGSGIVIAKKVCVNCTLSGGSSVKPSFW